MLSPEEIQKKIAQLNAREKQLLIANPVRDREPAQPTAFPVGTWILALLCAGAWLVGPVHAKDLISEDAAVYFSYAAMGFGALGLLLTVRWMVVGRSKDAQRYHEAARQLESIRLERGLLEGQLRRG